MKAQVGDGLVIEGTTTELADQRGLITDVHGPDGSPPYVVRWLNTGHEATVFPGSDALIVAAAEQQQVDKRARSQIASAHPPSAITPPPSSTTRHGRLRVIGGLSWPSRLAARPTDMGSRRGRR